MFLRRLRIEWEAAEGESHASPIAVHACPIAWIDNFAMRNFTNDAIFDDTLPVGDGLLEAGLRVPLETLRQDMEDWFRRKSYLRSGDRLRVTELPNRDPLGASGSLRQSS